VRVAVAFLGLLSAAACSRSSSSDGGKPAPSVPSSTTTTLSQPIRSQFTLHATGQPFDLRVEGGTVSFCDARGARKVNPTTRQDAAFQRACAKREPNTGCGELPLDVQVSSPGLGPNDVVEVSGSAFPLEGHVHDCAAHGPALAVATGEGVVLIDTTKVHVDVLDSMGGDRVAIGPGWIAWSKDSTIHVRAR